jgi:hypothetical protein
MINIIRKKTIPASLRSRQNCNKSLDGGRWANMYTSILLIISVYTVYTQTAENLIFAYRDSLQAGEHGEARSNTNLRPACQD